MAKKIYDEKITKATDWGGDESTGGLPVSGRRVQEFIKGELGRRYGYSRVADEKFLQQFESEEAARLYDEDPERYADLLLSAVQLPGTGETVAIMRVTVLQTPAEYTTEGVTEMFGFRYLSYYKDESDLSPMRGTAVLTVNGLERQRMDLRPGSTYSLEVTRYLTEEKNTVQVTVMNNEGSTRNFVYDVNIVNLGLESTFDETEVHTGAVSVRYTPQGNVLKTVHFLVDGEEVLAEETIVNNRQLTAELPAQEHGAHVLEMYATATVMGSEIRSRRLRHALVCVKEGESRPVIASVYEVKEVRQYETVSIPYVVYDPAGSPSTVTLWVNGVQVSERQVDRTRQVWTYRANEQGELRLKLVCGETEREFVFTITKSAVTAEAETQDLRLYLTSQGRSNQDTNREVWEWKDIRARLEGLNYATNGWVTDAEGSVCLRLSGGARASIPLELFGGDVLRTGKTIELEFAVRQVTDYGAVVLQCMDGGVGLELTPNRISLTSVQSRAETRYKEDERVRVSFVVEKQADNRLMQLYVNGIKSQSLQYPSTDSLTQRNPAELTMGSASATLDVYNIRVYDNNLNTRQLLDNYIADMDNIERKIEVFRRNEVFDSYGGLNLGALNRQVPVLVITGTLPNYKGDKQTVDISYTDVQHPEKSFTAEGCSINVQGTSSQYYPRKNFKFTAKKGFDMVQGGHAEGFTLNGDECLPATVFCLKADFAESSGTHNTGLADYVNRLLVEAGILTVRQQADARVRTTVYGEPCVVFHRATEEAEPEFIGKYNFNTDKAAENTFGFAEGDESWEFLNNTSDLALWRTADFSKWRETLEARYPDGSDAIDEARKVWEWVVSCKGDTEKFKAEVETYFDRRQLVAYYLLTLVFGMVDQRAKNMFLTRMGDGKWLFIFYDNDTCLGINNEGAIAFEYNVEIHDVVGSSAVWNGAESELWKLVEDAFAEEIGQLYYDLRQKGLLTYERVIEYMNTRQSDRWCEAVYNEDGYFKYEQPLVEGYEDWSGGSAERRKTGAYLYALQGSRDAHRRWWLWNRFKYLDSKFRAGSALSDYATFRTYTPAEWKGVAPKADITLRSFSAMYATVKWGSVMKSERMGEGQTVTVAAPEGMVFNDTETIVYNASRIASLGDLSPLYPGTVDVSRMVNLTELTVGSGAAGYQNTNFTVLSVGTNHVLRKLDIRNCPNFTQPIEVSGCEAIEEIYAAGTGTTAVNLAAGGSLRVLQLPESITSLTLKNQPKLTDEGLQLGGVGHVVALTVENTPGVDGYALLKRIYAEGSLRNVRLIGINATDANADFLLSLTGVGGMNEHGETTDSPVITGTLNVGSITEEGLAAVNAAYPLLTIKYGKLIKTPTRTITVKSNVDQSVIVGATVIINGNTYTTDDRGSVLIKTGVALSVTVSKVGMVDVTARFAAQSFDTFYNIVMDKMVNLIINVKDQLSVGIEGVKVTINATDYFTDKFGNVTIRAHRGTYSWSADYKGIVRSGSVSVAQQDVSASAQYDRVVDESMRPDADGSIQMLVVPDSGGNLTLSVRVDSLYTGGAVINWGDGTNTPVVKATTSYTHQYSGRAYFYISVNNPMSVTYAATSSHNLVAYWTIGRSVVTNLGFSSCSLLQLIGGDIFSNDTNRSFFNACFSDCRNLTSIPEGLFDNCRVTKTFESCFSNCERLASIPEGLFDNCTEITKFSFCFSGCHNLTSIPEGLFGNCTEATDFSHCFFGCRNLTSIPEGLFDNCTAAMNFSSCFAGCVNLISIPEGLFDDCTKTTDFGGCFSSCVNLTSIPEGLFDNCTKTTDFNRCFSDCHNLTSIPEGLFGNCTEATDFSNCFAACSSLTLIPEGLFDNCVKATKFYSCFEGCRNLTSMPEGLFDDCRVAKTFELCFRGCYKLTSIPEGLFDNCTAAMDFSACFEDCSGLTSIPEGLFDNCTKTTDFGGCFSSCTNLTSIPEGLFGNCTEATDFSVCFNYCINLTSIPKGLFDNCMKATKFYRCFSFCKRLTSIPKGLFDNCTAVTSFDQCFYSCEKLESIPAGLFDKCTTVTNFSDCFGSCRDLANINLPTIAKYYGWNGWSTGNSGTVAFVPLTTPPPMALTFSSTSKIYVPDEAVQAYKGASGWSRYAGQIYPRSEYVEPTAA